jgi:hypothetical protein
MSFENTSTTTPGLVEGGMSDDDAVAALTQRWTEEEDEDKTQSETEDTVDDEEDESSDEEDGDSDDGEADEDEGDDEAPATREATDDDEVKVRVGDEDHVVKVKDLKRLFGQEAALTKKSQALAAERKAAIETAQVNAHALERLFSKSAEKLQKYQGIDWAMAAKELDQESYTALREEAQSAFNEHQFFVQEVQGFQSKQQEMIQQTLRAQAKVANEILSDAIPEWGDRLYGEVRGYAIGLGMDADVVNNLTDPAAIQIIHKAMLYDQAHKTVAEKVTKAKAKTPKKVLKAGSRMAPSKKKVAMQKFQSTGSDDDAVAALLERWA